MGLLPLLFQAVSLMFACAATVTGAQAVIDPVGFSRSFGLPLDTDDIISATSRDTVKEKQGTSQSTNVSRSVAPSYVALMGIRQLATGLVLLLLAIRGCWAEMAIMLTVLGTVVAGTDGLHLARHGLPSHARFHAIPGALIAMLSATALAVDGL